MGFAIRGSPMLVIGVTNCCLTLDLASGPMALGAHSGLSDNLEDAPGG